MKKAAVVLLLIIIAAFVAYRWQKRIAEKAAGAPKIPLPPAATPPILPGASQQPQPGTLAGLYSTDSGPGAAAIQKRVSDIKENPDAAAAIRLEVAPDTAFLSGLAYLGQKITANIGAGMAAAGLDAVPVFLDNKQTAAVSGMAALTYVPPGYWSTLERVTNSAKSVADQTGVTVLAAGMYDPKNLNPIKNDLLTVIRPDAKGKGAAGAATDATKKLVADVSRFAQNWLAVSSAANLAAREKAISDLRASGWRFIGYDTPLNG